jgi:protein SCO1/2
MPWFPALLLLLLTACRQPADSKTTAPTRQVFSVTGLVQVLEPDGRTVVIQHAAIPNYMPAMTMPFTVKDARELRGLKAGDSIAFQLVVTADDGWIEHVSKLENAAPLAAVPAPAPPPPAQWRVAPPELAEGGLLPDYHLTNELGQAVSLSGYQGGVAVFTFFFTRCPYPNACPLLSSKFSQVLEKLPSTPGAPARWRLLSVSFDPANDTPAILKEYAQRCHYDPARWSFLTGGQADITDLAGRCGEHFQTTGDTISHDFRTVVVDPSGRVRKIIPGNTWSSDDLIREILNAAR